jgi:hypothetical protein
MISEKDILLWMQIKSVEAQKAFPELREVRVTFNCDNSEIGVYGYVGTGYDSRSHYAETLPESFAGLRAFLGGKAEQVQALREKAAALLFEAQELEDKQ